VKFNPKQLSCKIEKAIVKKDQSGSQEMAVMVL